MGPSDRLRRLLERAPVFDAHTDALQRALDLGADLAVAGDGQFDLERGRAGGLGAVVLVSWVDPGFLPDGAEERARALMQAGHALAERRPDALGIARTKSDLAATRARGAVAGFLGIEGGHALERGIASLQDFHAFGLRVLTLVWNNHLDWIRSCEDGAGAHVPAGLSEEGRAIVRRMDELGIVCDLSHAGVRSFYDALETTRNPVIASHSGCRRLHDHPRNLDDDQLHALAANGGVIGIVFHPPFLSKEARATEARLRDSEGYREIGGSPSQQFMERGAWMQRTAPPFSLEGLVAHVEHALEVAGPRHVGLGSDFDGIQRGPVGLESAAGYWRVGEALLERGYDEETVGGVLGRNFERVFESVLPD